MIPFQLHRRIPLLRRPFFQKEQAFRERDQAIAERDALVIRLDHLAEEVEVLKTERQNLVADRDRSNTEPTAIIPEQARAVHSRHAASGQCPERECSGTSEEDFRFVQTGDNHVYCVINGRRRHVPYSGWWADEGWLTLPHIEAMEECDFLEFPLGPTCPPAAQLEGKSMGQIVQDLHLMRIYLGSLVSGSGIEFGAGNRPIPVSLRADVKYVDAFRYGSERSRSFPGAIAFGDFMPIDVVDKLEVMSQFQDNTLDFVLASHVIEHCSNTIAALVAANRVLCDDGKLILIVPDRNGTFDRRRDITEISHMVLDYEDYRRERDLIHYEEWNTRVVDGTSEKAKAEWQDHVDLHYHCFTPNSFLMLLSATMGYASWRSIQCFVPRAAQGQAAIEFYVVLQK